MSHVSAEYNGDLLTPDQIDLLHADLVAELDEFAAEEPEPEADTPALEATDPEPEPEIEL